ncbi:MAG TPA: hypothetical protein VFQ53_41440 [Kofleriaceae bacterium]|nr:hypothetical protein [Kofleriaceae bacterium]
MSRKHRKFAAFQPIARSHLEYVVGGRLAVAKGPDPAVVRGMQGLVEAVGAVGQSFAAQKAAKEQQMGQVMQQMMQQRGGR